MTSDDLSGVGVGEPTCGDSDKDETEDPWYCMQCSVEYDVAFVPHKDIAVLTRYEGTHKGYLMVECAGCATTLIDEHGRCRGSVFCRRHDTTPQWKRLYWRLRSRLRAKYEFVRDHVVPWRRHHILDLRTVDYRHGWCDADLRVLYACFNVLVEFYEKEHPLDRIDWSGTEETRHVAQELRALYAWWVEERPARLQDGEDFEGMREEEDAMLLRLMQIRHYLWT